MALRYPIIAGHDGTNTVHMYAASLMVQNPYPEIKYTSADKSFQMRPTANGPGNLVHRSLGSNVNHGEISFTIHKISSADMVKLLAIYEARPNVVLFSLDSGTTRYYAKFKENGFVPEGYSFNEDPVTGTAFFYKAHVDLYLLQTTTQNFIS